jgi:histone H3/H4
MADDYARALAKVAAGQLAELAGYEAVQDSAAEVLAELLMKYTTELATGSHNYAELANRSSINAHDVLLALDDVGSSVPELQTYMSTLSSVSKRIWVLAIEADH